MSALPAAADRLSQAGAWVFLAAAVVVPIRVVTNEVAGVDLHLTALLIGLAGLLAGLRLLAAGLPQVHLLDVLMVAFVAWCAVHLLWLGEPHPRALKGFLIETRFAWIYAVARALGLGRVYGARLLRLYLGLAIAIGVYGLVEYFFWWGSLTQALEITGDPRYAKMRIPRLYSLVITPAGMAYFLFGALCAAGARWTDARRALPVAATAVAWVALPLTLTRSAFAWGIAVVVALSAMRRDMRSFFAVSVLCGMLSIFLFWATGVASGLATYARGATSDRSAEIHVEALESGSATVSDRLLGYGFGHAGALAFGGRGMTQIGETYYLILAGQAGVPALALVGAIQALLAWLAFRALRAGDPADERSRIGLFVLTFLAGTVAGSVFLPIGSTAWIQLYLFTLAPALVETGTAPVRGAGSGSAG